MCNVQTSAFNLYKRWESPVFHFIGWGPETRESRCSQSHEWERWVWTPACWISKPVASLLQVTPGNNLRIRQLNLSVIIAPTENLCSPFQISPGSFPQLPISSVLSSNSGHIPFARHLPTHLRNMYFWGSQDWWAPTILLSHPESMRERCIPSS